jgi:hypothetical protein
MPALESVWLEGNPCSAVAMEPALLSLPDRQIDAKPVLRDIGLDTEQVRAA